jgi:hypothetical protein
VVCRTFGLKRRTLIDSLAWIGWSDGLRCREGTSDATTAIDRSPDQRRCSPPTDQRELVRHYTSSAADLAAIRRCRGDHNRIGHALMLCYLRYPGRPLRAGERPPWPLLLFIAEQIDALPESIEDYLAAERNRQRHWPNCRTASDFVPSGRVRPRIWPVGCCRTRSRTTGLRILLGCWWRSAGGAETSSHRPARSSGSASKPAIRRVVRPNAG